MDEDQIDNWRLDWADAVRNREARKDLLLALSSRPMVTTRRIAWQDAGMMEILSIPEQTIATVAPLPFTRLGRVWIDGVRAPADVTIDEYFREPTQQELHTWSRASVDQIAI